MPLYIVHTYLSFTVEYIHYIADMTVSPYSPYSIPRATPVFIFFIRKTRIQDIRLQCQTLRWDNVRHVQEAVAYWRIRRTLTGSVHLRDGQQGLEDTAETLARKHARLEQISERYSEESAPWR